MGALDRANASHFCAQSEEVSVSSSVPRPPTAVLCMQKKPPDIPELRPPSIYQGDLEGTEGFKTHPSSRRGSLGQLASSHPTTEDTQVKIEFEPGESTSAAEVPASRSTPQHREVSGTQGGQVTSTETICKTGPSVDGSLPDCSSDTPSESRNSGPAGHHDHTVYTLQANNVLMRVTDSIFVRVVLILLSSAALGKYIGCHGGGEGPSNPQSRRYAGSGDSSSKRQPRGLRPNQIVNRSRGDDDYSEDEDANKRRRARAGVEDPAQDRETKFFACPYLKRYPSLYHRKCYTKKLKSPSRVKYHLTREGCHCRPPYCSRCFQTFQTEAARDSHVRAGNCQLVESPVEPQGLSSEAREGLRKKLDSRLDDEAQWFTIWDILFPGVDRPASPYNNPEDLAELFSSQLQNLQGGIQERFASTPFDQDVPEVPQAAFRGWNGSRLEETIPNLGPGSTIRSTLSYSPAASVAVPDYALSYSRRPPYQGSSASVSSNLHQAPPAAAPRAAYQLRTGTSSRLMPPALDTDMSEATGIRHYQYGMMSPYSDGTRSQAAATPYVNGIGTHPGAPAGSLHDNLMTSRGPSLQHVTGNVGFDVSGPEFEASQAFDGLPNVGLHEQLMASSSWQPSSYTPLEGFIYQDSDFSLQHQEH